uniref:Ig-like domain-containing protein n=1 Tax=Cyprinus carpio carpio TaxID=630221 RepID=A0A9J7XZG3_CYPCA
MSDECHLCLLGLIFLSSLLTGINGVNDAHVFISSGENVRLPCNNALHDCTSTTWIYNRFRDSGTVELIKLGIKNKDTERHERLSLGSDCSLNIRNISTEDYGSYTCRQYVNDKQQGTDARVFLHVLHVSSSQTEISAGLSVTLFCQLYSSPRVSCDDWIGSERIQLFWVNQAGVKLTRSDSRYQILSSSDRCIFTLNTTLLNEDDNREWRCEVTQRDQVQTSVTHTVKSSAQADSTTALTSTEVIVIVVCASFVLLLLALILWMMIRKKRSGVRRATDDSVDPSSRAGTNSLFCESNLESLHSSPESRQTSPSQAEQTDDVTYTEVTAFSKNRAKKNKVHCDDKVTYASIGGAKAGALEDYSQLYASVN